MSNARYLFAGVAVAATVVASPMVAAQPAPGSSAPGSVIEVGDLPAAVGPEGAAQGRRITYWSTGPQNQPVRVTGMLLVPPGTAPQGGWPVMGWHHGTVGISPQCAPSAAKDDPETSQFLSRWLAAGYAIAATDYAFYGDPAAEAYLVKSEAYNEIDMVRAARAAVPGLSNQWVAVGHSQGGKNTLVTAAVAADYAPDLDLRATIAYAPANHFTEQLLAFGNPATPASLTPGEVTAYAAYGLRALTVARPDFDLDSYLTPIGKQILADTARLCLDPMTDRVSSIGFGQMLTKPLAVGGFPTVAATTFDIPLTGYQRPVFIAQGLADTAVFSATTDLLATELTAHANPLTYRRYPDQDHMSILATATEDALAFAETNLHR